MVVLQQTTIGADPIRTLAAVSSQAAATVPAAILIMAAALLNLTAGAILVRLMSGSPYGSFAQASLAGLVGAVALDLVLLGSLGALGLFSWPLLLAAQLGVVALGRASRARPFISRTTSADWSLRELPLAWILIVLVWSSPIVLQLASPVVPFFDVLPNHVAPVEHLRTFAGLSVLDLAPSPAFGPRAIFLGFEALLGNASAITSVPAVTAVAAFALPMTLLLGGAAWGLARSVGGPRAGIWALLLVPLSLTFLHLSDARAAVLVWPLVGFAVWQLVEPLGSTPLRRAAVLTATLTAAIYIHPLQGFIAVAAVALAILTMPRVRRSFGLLPIVAPLVLGTPQWATMAGIALPSWVLVLVPLVAAGVFVAARNRTFTFEGLLGRRWPGVVVLAGAAVVGTVAALMPANGAQQFAVDSVVGVAASVVLVVGALHSVLVARDRPGYWLLWFMPAAGLLAALVASAVRRIHSWASPLRTRCPRQRTTWSGHSWPFVPRSGSLPVWARVEWPALVRATVVGIFVVAAAAPIRLGAADPLALGEHRLAEVASTNWAVAAAGYWQGYPDRAR